MSKIRMDDSPVIRLDVEGRVLAKCPSCECEYHLMEHDECVDEYATAIKRYNESIAESLEMAIKRATEYITQMTALRFKVIELSDE